MGARRERCWPGCAWCDATGLPINLRSSVLRNVLRIVDILPENYVVGLVSMLLSPSGERLGDHVAGTIVIRLDRPQAAREFEAVAKGRRRSR